MLAHNLVGEKCGIARVDNLHFLQHLANDHLHVLDVDIDTLRTIDFLDFLNQVAGRLLDAHQLKETLRVDGALGKLITHAHVRSILDAEPGHRRDFELDFDTCFGHDKNLLLLLEVLLFHIDDVQYAIHRRDDRLPLWRTSFEDLLDARQTGCDINDRDASCVERAEGELRTGFADGLSRDDTDCLSDLNIIAGGQVTAVAHGTHAILALTCDGRTKAHTGNAKLLDSNRCFVMDETILGNKNDIFAHDHLDGRDAGAFGCRKHLLSKSVPLLCKSLLSLSRHDVCRNGSVEDTFKRRLRPNRVYLDRRCAKHDIIGCIPAGNLFAETNDDGTAVDDRLNSQATNIPLDLQELEAEGLQAFCLLPRDLLAGLNDGLSGQRIDDLFVGDLARQLFRKGRYHQIANLDLTGLRVCAVFFADHQFVRDIDKTTRQVARVRCLQCRVSLSLAGTVCRQEVLEDRQTFTEVGLDGELDDLSRRVRHQASDPRHLHNLLLASTGTGVGHDTHGVLFGKIAEDGPFDLFALLLPDLNHLEVAIVVRKKTILVEFVDLADGPVGIVEDMLPLVWHFHVRQSDRYARFGRILESECLDVVKKDVSLGHAKLAREVQDHRLDLLLGHRLVLEGEVTILGLTLEDGCPEFIVEHDAACSGTDLHATKANENRVVDAQLPGLEEVEDVQLAVNRSGIPLHRLHSVFDLIREVVGAEHHVLDGAGHGVAACRREDVVGRKHEQACLRLGRKTQGKMDGHLVSVEVSVERSAHERRYLNSLVVDEDGFEGLDRQTVKGRRTVQQNDVALDDLLKDTPHFWCGLLDNVLGNLHAAHDAFTHEPVDDMRLEQFERHFLGNTALTDLELRS